MKVEVSQLQEEKDELTKKMEESVDCYKEQVRQHSVTICSMEERLSKLTKRNKDFQEEASTLKKSNAGRFTLAGTFTYVVVTFPYQES